MCGFTQRERKREGVRSIYRIHIKAEDRVHLLSGMGVEGMDCRGTTKKKSLCKVAIPWLPCAAPAVLCGVRHKYLPRLPDAAPEWSPRFWKCFFAG